MLIFGPGVVSFTPSDSWMFKTDTLRIPVTGWCQGAALHVGKGRAAFFGEAAMFSAQVEGPNREPFGMNAPGAEQNPQFILNLLHWLSGLLDETQPAIAQRRRLSNRESTLCCLPSRRCCFGD